MRISFSACRRIIAAIVCTLLLPACTPAYDWREVRGTDAPFVILMPAKPLTVSRPVDLGGLHVIMTMTAAEAGGGTFAVGTAELPDASRAPAALDAMKTAMVRNIGGTIRREKSAAAAESSGTVPNRIASIEIEAVGAAARILFARFVAKDKRVYQIVVTGRENDVEREAVETLFTSFKLD